MQKVAKSAKKGEKNKNLCHPCMKSIAKWGYCLVSLSPTMKSKDSPAQDSSPDSLDLSALSGFQFGPAWARSTGEKKSPSTYASPRTERRGPQDRTDRAPRRDSRGYGDRQDRGPRPAGNRQGDRPFERRDGAARGEQRRGGDNRRGDQRRGAFVERAPLPELTSGLRVELRPVDAGLTNFAHEVHKHKRAVALIDLAKLVMGAKDRYDLVFMKQEGGPDMIVSKKGDLRTCWLTREEAISALWSAAWLADFYDTVEEEVPAPKGSFQSIAKCGLSGQWLGPVNWHGYPSAVMALHRQKFSKMPFDRFKAKVVIETSPEAVEAWLASVSKKTSWKPKREGGADILLADARAVEKDFVENHFDEAYEVVDKVFINGDTPRARLSPGLGAHLAVLSDKTRKFPQMLIPNLCHGLARHHMPIFKWQGNHYTGPARPRAIPTGTVLADRMTAITQWVRDHSGKRVDVMLKELAGIMPEDKESAEAQAVQDVHAEWVADLLWLLEQGFIIAMTDGTICWPKTGEAEAASSASTTPVSGAKAKSKKRPAKAKAAKKVAGSTEGGDSAEAPKPEKKAAKKPVSKTAKVEAAVKGESTEAVVEEAVEADVSSPAPEDVAPAVEPQLVAEESVSEE